VHPAEQVSRFLVERVRTRHGRRALQGQRHPALALKESSVGDGLALVASTRLCGVPEPAVRALVGWANRERPAVLLDHIPTPRALLQLMANGLRCVTLLDDAQGLDFVLHDLCHLEKFSDPAHHREQIAFFATLQANLERPQWRALDDLLDDKWRADLEHVISDMNGSPHFLAAVLRGSLRAALRRARLDARLLDDYLTSDGFGQGHPPL
jgi:hypothetical protein